MRVRVVCRRPLSKQSIGRKSGVERTVKLRLAMRDASPNSLQKLTHRVAKVTAKNCVNRTTEKKVKNWPASRSNPHIK